MQYALPEVFRLGAADLSARLALWAHIPLAGHLPASFVGLVHFRMHRGHLSAFYAALVNTRSSRHLRLARFAQRGLCRLPRTRQRAPYARQEASSHKINHQRVKCADQAIFLDSLGLRPVKGVSKGPMLRAALRQPAPFAPPALFRRSISRQAVSLVVLVIILPKLDRRRARRAWQARILLTTTLPCAHPVQQARFSRTISRQAV